MNKGSRIKPVYSGKNTAVEEYKVVDEKGITQFVGSYTECYYVLFPNAEREWMDKEKFDEVYKDD